MIIWGLIKFIVLIFGWTVFAILVAALLIVLYFKLKNKFLTEPETQTSNKPAPALNQPIGGFSGTTVAAGLSSSGTTVGFALAHSTAGTQSFSIGSIPAPANAMSQKQILQDLISQTQDIVQKHPFYSWSLMMAGVELLGTFLDTSNSFFVDRESGNRFKNAIDKLFPPSYQPYKDRLYKELRCGVNHYTLPHQTIILSERIYNKQNLSSDQKGNLILVAEDFFGDFKNACEQIIVMLDAGTITATIYHQLV